MGRRAVNPDYEFRRVRNTYSIEPALLDCANETGAVAQYGALAELLNQPITEAWSDYIHARVTGSGQQP